MFSKLKLFFSRFFNGKGSKTSKLNELPSPFLEALALHNIFMAFGISEKDIYVAYADRRFQVVAYQESSTGSVLFDDMTNNAAKPQRREFAIEVAELDMNKDSFVELWNKTVQMYNTATSDERVAMTENTKSYAGMVQIVLQMLSKGFRSEMVNMIVDKIDGNVTKESGGSN